MKIKVVQKQRNSDDCIVCGFKNDASIRARFYELENQEVVSFFTMLDCHQSYPERAHGGVSAAVLDETIGRAIKCFEPDGWGVTVELNVKYKKPVPLNVELKAVGRITSNRSRVFKGTGEIYLPSGEVAAICEGTYVKMSPGKITDVPIEEGIWQYIEDENHLDYVELEDENSQD